MLDAHWDDLLDERNKLEAENAQLRKALDKAETRLLIFKEMPSCLWDEDDEEVLKEVIQALAATQPDKESKNER
jgi:hypothetical protein